ncbi:MAX gene-associated protein isoform X18 [Dasypus novemcinctus]|uniref:MAX gene-associated protein isoform X18 n=1 Tax=Dasypus novemcinctus TaxID=9361 RepID=UPI00265DE0F5|nr:MAX gene-associated protein isoform X16 [Dasypus novemcinctus]XP_058149961.1 MAX gene-associated protein isoform X16 [Dasypus novemcinctus]
MEEKQQIILANQDSGTMAGATPTFFVILKQPGNGKTDQGILVTNRDACALASNISSPGKSKGKICLPADCTMGGITVTLDNNSMWNEFYHRSTEMILTKQGRRMFPYCRYWITGLDSNMKYILVMDISPVDNHRYKWNGRWWEPSGKAEPHVLGRVFIHPESPSTGHYWMHQPVSFYKLKLTNNTLDQEGHIILHSMHRYLPRLHLVPADKATEVIQLNGPGVHTFTFPQTEFFAVTAYQNIQITQLKIDYNPFAKGFRDDGLNSKPQRDGKQKNSSDQEGNSVPSSPGHRVHLTEGEGSEILPSDPDLISRGHETSGKGLEKPSLNVKQDFLGFMDSDSALGEVPQLKQEVSESLDANNFEDGSHVASPLDPNGHFSLVIKEEPQDDYDYELGECPEGVTVKQEETDEETDVYSNSDDDPILEKQLKRHNKSDNLEADHPSSKWLPSSPSGVAKAKMFKLDTGKMPVVYLEPCAVTKSTVKISELPDNIFSTSRKDKSSMLAELDYLPTYIENSSGTGFCVGKESENGLRKPSSDLRVVQKYSLFKEPQWKYPDISDSISTEGTLDSSKSSTGDSFSGKEDLGRKGIAMFKITAAPKAMNASQSALPNVPGKRGRPRKLKLSKAGRPPKNTGKSLTSTKNTPVGLGSTFPEVKPDLEDVDGVLFVSFESKEALDIHAVDGTTEESSSLQALPADDPGCRTRISQLEKELIEDLKSLRHKQVIHPGLQEVGLKLNSVDPTVSIDLKYLGVQLPLAPATSFPYWNLTGTNPASPDAGFPFVSRTGKTNDFTKIKGWRGKFHSASASRNEGGNSESSLKNRSAFCSDKLDEYLENEGKLMETSMGFSSNAPASPVVYQLPTKSTSYVRTLDSVLKKQSVVSPSTSYSLKPHSVSSASRKAKSQNKQTTFSGRTKPSYKSILPYPVSPKQKQSHMIPGDKVTKNSSSSISENQVNNFVVPTLDENIFPKQISLRQAHQQQQQQQLQGTRPPGLSKSQVKLMDLEDCALWEGKPRTYITEERADVSLTTLLTAQASLKTKPIHTIVRKRAPPCNNDFCRLGCICSSLALEKRQPAHCRRPDCMFGCTCLKRKVVLVKGGSKTKHFQRKSAHRDPVFYDTLGEEPREEGEEGFREEEEQLKEKKKRKKVEYTICETEPEQPVQHYPLWVKVEGEVDPEPVYIPTPSVIEPVKPLLMPQPEVLSTTVKGKLLTGIKPVRAYTPKPNPVIREEDKDPVYLYFESMMTCARVRVYERKKEERKQPSPPPSPSFQQQSSCHSSPENCSAKEPDSEQQPLKQVTCDLENDSDKSQENAPQIPVAPQVSPNTMKRAGPRLLLIPVQQGSPTLRPIPNTQLQGHRMVLQPVRSPSGMNLFRHPNGQIVQLLPLHQLRGSNTQPSLQPVMFRNPGSVMGIRLPAPSKPSETPPTSASSSAFSVVNPVIQAVGSSTAVNVITQAPSLLSSGPSFMSQAGTLTLRISPPEPQSFTSKTGSETKIPCSSGGQSLGTASLIPLQSGSFALLQLPGQKPIPSSILQHVASLQMKRESQNADQKDETSSLSEQEIKKPLQSEGDTVDPEANIMKQNPRAATASAENLNDSLEDRVNHLDEESLMEEGPATAASSKPSFGAGSQTGEECKDLNEECGIRNHNNSKEKLTLLEVKTISEKASNTTVQSISNVQLKKLGDVKVEQQKGENNPEEKSNEFPVISKEESKLGLSGSKVGEQQLNPQPEVKEKRGKDSLEKDSIRERWRKHLKGPFTRNCVATSQECKKEAEEQLIKVTKTCQENSHVYQQEQDISDILGKSGTTENAGVLKTECDSWSRISNPAAFSIVPRRATKGSREDGHFQGHLLLPGEQIPSKQEKKGGRSSADLTVLDLEDEDEEDENEKTDDSIDEIVDVVSDYQSEEVDDVEKNNCVEYTEDDEEQVDIETVEDLPEEINVAHMKTTAAPIQSSKQLCHTHISTEEKAAERSRKAPSTPLKLKPDYWSEKLQKEAEAFAYYRRTHTANERRRRGEMRDLFEKLKMTLGLLHSSKVSKSLILTRAFSEIQGLTDQADKLIGQKNLLTRKRNILIRKVSSLSGKTEEVVLKKLEYIYAKQQALEAQKRKKKVAPDEFDGSPIISKQLEGSSSSVDLGQMFINNRRGKPLILSRKRDQATENISPSNTPHTSANLVMTPQGQLLTLKGPLFSGPVVTVSPAFLEADLKPQVASSAVAHSENDDLFMMPRIVNVTSLATEGGLVDIGGSKYPHEVSDGKPPDHLKDTIRHEENSFEDSGRLSSRSNHRDRRVVLGPTKVFLANKDSGFPQIVDVSSMQEAQEFLSKKISGNMREIQYKRKESESRGERLKPKESTFHKLKMKELKDSSIEMELRKVASEVALDPSEILTNMEDENDTDETLTSLLSEIAFLNQQLNDDSVSLAELPSPMGTEFPGDARQSFINKVPPGNRVPFRVGHVETGLKELPDGQEGRDSISPLLLHLEDDDLSENEKQLAEPASEPDVLKIVIDSEIKDSLLSHRKANDGGKSTSGLPAEPEGVSSPPVLHMKTGLENSSTDTLWRPMPKLAPLGLKVANPSSDADGQSLKVMPCLAPIAAKIGSVGHKTNLTGTDQEGRESKVMPTLAPVVAKLGNSGSSPSTAGK